MIVKIHSPLVTSVRNGFALIDLHLTSFLTYKQDDMDVKVLEFEWLVTVHVSNEYLNEHLTERVHDYLFSSIIKLKFVDYFGLFRCNTQSDLSNVC